MRYGRWLHGLLLCIPFIAMGYAVELVPQYPAHYTVQDNDSLWDVSSHFLVKPWQWQQLWHNTPQIRDPNRLFPGDVISVSQHDHAIQLQLLHPVVASKHAPRIRYSPIPPVNMAIPRSKANKFLKHFLIWDKQQLTHAARIAALQEDELLVSAGKHIYTKDALPPTARSYHIIHPGRTYYGLDGKTVLGYEAADIGRARVVNQDAPSTLLVTHAIQEIHAGDYVIPDDQAKREPYFMLKAPASQINGHIVDVVDGLETFGQKGIVVIDQGKNVGLVPGDVLAIYTTPRTVASDIFHQDMPQAQRTKLPSTRIGELMVFNVFSKASYAFVVHTNQNAKVSDEVRNP